MSSTASYDPRVLRAPHPVPGAPDNWKRFFTFNTDAKVIGVIIIGSLILAPIWPLIVAGFVVTAVLDEREKQRREDARRSRQDGTPPGP
jgi:cytochrome c oxidase subunit 1